jgi:dihydroorotate dehydrogenase electron transfer subunit
MGAVRAKDFLRVVKIVEIRRETPNVKTLYFEDALCSKAKPGQFVMVWIPHVDEVPMSLSTVGKKLSITVAKVGEATAALHAVKAGDFLGIRGPYGKAFRIVDGRVLVVGGGCGMAPLAPLVEVLVANGRDVTLVIGAKTKRELLFLEKFRGLSDKLIAVTEDGSYGVKGTASGVAAKFLKKERFNVVYTCGKELMIWKVYRSAVKANVRVQASLERYMRCGVGVCGSCSIGRYRVCRDGPVFSRLQLEEMEGEFGRSFRDPTGRLARLIK